MSKYLLAYRGGGMPESAEDQARVMAAWGEWFGRLGGAVADPGNPTSGSRTIASDGRVSNGTPSITGYSIISADSLDAAVSLAKDCPVLSSGASIEVLETVDVM
ncbi:MAG TPA: hypothetical protein VF802_02500 [Candidatus Limnocylindrales bacterium]